MPGDFLYVSLINTFSTATGGGGSTTFVNNITNNNTYQIVTGGTTNVTSNITQNVSSYSGPAISAGAASQGSGTVVFSNSNGVTFGLNAGTLTASVNAGAGGGAGTAGAITGGSMTVNTSGISINLPAYLTTAQPVGAYLTTAAQVSHSHGNPTLNLTNLSGTTASASNGFTLSLSAAAPGGGAAQTFSGGTASAAPNPIYFSNANGVSFGMGTGANSSVMTGSVATNYLTTAAQVSHSHGAVSLSLSAISGTYSSASNGLTISLTGNTGGAGGGAAISASGSSQNSGTVVFSNSNGVSFGMNGSTVTASYAATDLTVSQNLTLSQGTGASSTAVTIIGPVLTQFLTTQTTNQIATVFASSNTVGASSGTINLSAIVMRGVDQLSVGVSNGTLIFEHGGADPLWNRVAASNSTVAAGSTVIFSNSNNMSFGITNGSQLTASANAAATNVTTNNMATAERGNYFYTSNNTFANSTHNHGGLTINATNISTSITSASNGLTINLSAANAGAINQTGPNIAVPGATITAGTVVFSSGNGISFGLAGSTMTGSVLAPYTARTYQNRQLGASSTVVQGNNSMWLCPFRVEVPVSASSFVNLISFTGTITSAATAQAGLTIDHVLYSQHSTDSNRFDSWWSSQQNFTFWNSGTSSYSYSYNVTSGSSAGSNLGTANVMGIRMFTHNIGTTMQTGLWLYGSRLSSSTAGYSAAMSRISPIFDAPVNVALGFMGSATNASVAFQDAGTWTSATTASPPATVSIGHIAGVSNIVPWFKVGAL